MTGADMRMIKRQEEGFTCSANSLKIDIKDVVWWPVSPPLNTLRFLPAYATLLQVPLTPDNGLARRDSCAHELSTPDLPERAANSMRSAIMFRKTSWESALLLEEAGGDIRSG